MGDAHVFDPGIVAGKLLDVGGLFDEVHLLLGDRPHLVQDHSQVHDVLDPADRRHQVDQSVQKTDVPGHRVVDSLALHFDNDVLPCLEDRPVHLGDRGGSERFFVD